jgi:hypothetical protein
MKSCDHLIIGAGLSGLILAKRLKAAGANVLIVEKSKSVGGRMATRRDGDATFDHGAQFSSEQFSDFFSEPLWKPWMNLYDKPKYAVDLGINKAAKYLALGLDILCNEKAISIHRHEDESIVNFESGVQIKAKQLYLSCPVPQSLDLLKSASISYPAELNDVLYAKALVGLFRIETDCVDLKNLKYKEDPERGIFSVSNQLSKGVSQNLAFTVVMNPQFSEKFFDYTEAEIIFFIENCFTSFITNHYNLSESGFSILRSQVKKWRYSHPLTTFGTEHCAVESKKIILFGDGFAGGSLARAAKSAMSVPI